MLSYRRSFKKLRIPLLGVILLEVLWNAGEVIIDPAILDIPLHLVKYLLYGLAGYISTRFYRTGWIQGALAGALTASIGALVEGLLISPLFYTTFFYTPAAGFPMVEALSHVLVLTIIGAICGYLGSVASTLQALEVIAYTLKFEAPDSDDLGIPDSWRDGGDNTEEESDGSS